MVLYAYIAMPKGLLDTVNLPRQGTLKYPI